jgi:hypothetical protein
LVGLAQGLRRVVGVDEGGAAAAVVSVVVVVTTTVVVVETPASVRTCKGGSSPRLGSPAMATPTAAPPKTKMIARQG